MKTYQYIKLVPCTVLTFFCSWFSLSHSKDESKRIGKPRSLEKLGAAAAADKMLTDRAALERGHVPSTPNIIASMGLLFPGQKEVLNFTAPKDPGEYVYVCTFPGALAHNERRNDWNSSGMIY